MCLGNLFDYLRSKVPYDADSKHAKTDYATACTRLELPTHRFTQAVMTIFCEHGKCVGFFVLVDPESEGDAFDLFLCRTQAGTHRWKI